MTTKKSIIRLYEVTHNSIEFIEGNAAIRIIATKGQDEIVWTIKNETAKDLEVAVVDFYPLPTSTGGSPTTGDIPGKKKVVKKTSDDTDSLNCDGDVGIYKYTVLAREAKTGSPWFNVRDPELEIDP